MNFNLHRQGQTEGPFPLEELRRRREAGELTGAELVWREGMPTWQTLESVLRQQRPDVSAAPAGAPRRRATPALAWIIALVAVLVLVGLGAVGWMVRARVRQAIRQSAFQSLSDAGVAEARKQVTWTTNTLTAKDISKRAREFRLRQWLDGYDQRGDHSQACDALARRLIVAWIDQNYGGPNATNATVLAEWAGRLAVEPACTDPLVLTVVAENVGDREERVALLERAVHGFEGSPHRAYPKFYAGVNLANNVREASDRRQALEAAALRWQEEMFKDGSLLSGAEPELAEILLKGWGQGFWERNRGTLYPLVAQAGESFAWLAALLEGEHHVKEAWKARGSGYADTVTPDGWRGFSEHLAVARRCFTEAWKLHPESPQAPSRMISVAMGDADAEEMRLWFDRAVTAQIDYPDAWSHLRWGLRPRWRGSHAAMLALGVTALSTARFDTEVPRVFMDIVRDLESETETPYGSHIWGRADIWPQVQRLYAGYLAEPVQARERDRWRTTYAVVAHLAGHDDVARTQLEALSWQPRRRNLEGWGVDFALLPLEVAARTSPASNRIAEAESWAENGQLAKAAQIYAQLGATNHSDERARAFIRQRQAALAIAQQMQKGQWVELLPGEREDVNWVFLRGDHERLADGTLQIDAGAEGHLLYSCVPVPNMLEVRGEFEVIKTSNGAFQAGLALGLPALYDSNWIAIMMKRGKTGKDTVCLTRAWSDEGLIKPVSFKDGPNAYLFRLQGTNVTLLLNGEQVWSNVPRPQPIYVAEDDARLGLGAPGDKNATVLRYRHLQVRWLGQTPPAAPKL